MMTWGGNVLRVKVRPGAPGTWQDAGLKHEVYAIKESATGVTFVLVADDAAKLQLVSAEHCEVGITPPGAARVPAP